MMQSLLSIAKPMVFVTAAVLISQPAAVGQDQDMAAGSASDRIQITAASEDFEGLADKIRQAKEKNKAFAALDVKVTAVGELVVKLEGNVASEADHRLLRETIQDVDDRLIEFQQEELKVSKASEAEASEADESTAASDETCCCQCCDCWCMKRCRRRWVRCRVRCWFGRIR